MKTLRLGLFCLAFGLITFGCQRPAEAAHASAESNAPAAPSAAQGVIQKKNVLLEPEDRVFMKEAEDGDIKGRNLAREIMQRSQYSNIIDYAKMIDSDHTKDLQSVYDLMTKGIRQAKDMPKVKLEAEARLNGLSGQRLNREFLAIMIEDHEKAIAKYTLETGSGAAPSVRDYATQTLPTLEKHLKHAQDLQTSGPEPILPHVVRENDAPASDNAGHTAMFAW